MAWNGSARPGGIRGGGGFATNRGKRNANCIHVGGHIVTSKPLVRMIPNLGGPSYSPRLLEGRVLCSTQLRSAGLGGSTSVSEQSDLGKHDLRLSGARGVQCLQNNLRRGSVCYCVNGPDGHSGK